MLALALDTATSGVTVGVLERDQGGWRSRSTATRQGPRPRHGELLAPSISECLTRSGCRADELDVVVVGNGPGPFTGLRVGLATAAALGAALGRPVYGVCSLDAIAVGRPGAVLVAADARRREVYWAFYRDGVRTSGPHVDRPDVVLARLPELAPDVIVGEGARLYGFPGAQVGTPSARGLVTAAGSLLDRPPPPLEARYLRRPDATEPAPRTPGGLR